jgi:hypothetical protein
MDKCAALCGENSQTTPKMSVRPKLAPDEGFTASVSRVYLNSSRQPETVGTYDLLHRLRICAEHSLK